MRRRGLLGLIAAVPLALAACTPSEPTGGLVEPPAQNDAQERRLDAYRLYAEEDGRSAAWVDQDQCVTNAAIAVNFTATDLALPGIEESVVPGMRAEALALGDELGVAALDEAVRQGTALVEPGGPTLREAIAAAVALCEASELGDDHVAAAIDAAVVAGAR